MRLNNNVTLLLVTIVIAVSISVGMWVIGVIPFNEKTFALHIISIYIGVAGVLLFQLWRKR